VGEGGCVDGRCVTGQRGAEDLDEGQEGSPVEGEGGTAAGVGSFGIRESGELGPS